jgi:rhodanese-related sulfurtransferase
LQKLKSLPDAVKVYPAHGPGSSCGKNLGPNTHSTIGEEKATNYAMADMSKEDFIAVVTEGLSTPPVYFPINAGINKKGYMSLDALKGVGLRPLSVQEVKELHDKVILLDTRKATVFTQAFVPGSISIGLEGRFAEWAGAMLPFHDPMVLITEQGKEEETLVRLARVGFDQVVGYLDGGFEAWQAAGEPIDMIIDIEADELKMDINYDNKLLVVDVRKELEFDNGHVVSAVNVPLNTFTDLNTLSNFDDQDNLYIHCAGGYRSVIASSLLKRQGYHNLRNVLGGYEQIKQVPGMPIEVAKQAVN